MSKKAMKRSSDEDETPSESITRWKMTLQKQIKGVTGSGTEGKDPEAMLRTGWLAVL